MDQNSSTHELEKYCKTFTLPKDIYNLLLTFLEECEKCGRTTPKCYKDCWQKYCEHCSGVACSGCFKHTCGWSSCAMNCEARSGFLNLRCQNFVCTSCAKFCDNCYRVCCGDCVKKARCEFCFGKFYSCSVGCLQIAAQTCTNCKRQLAQLP